MQQRATTKRAKRRNQRRRRFAWLPSARTRKRWWKRFRRLPPGGQVAIGLAATLLVWLAVNFAYQVIRKPTELFFPVSGVLYKTPRETWNSYAPIFRRHSTAVMSPELLAALAQVEGSGNPVARTYWRWSLTHKPFEVYKPASSAVGMYQITNGTFAQARKYCVHNHVVVEDGPWHAWRSCWFNWAYSRVIPSHAVEMTSAYLDREVARIVASRGGTANVEQKRKLATIIHLCGAGAGAVFARRNYRLLPGQRCGDHSVAGYLNRVQAMRAQFAGFDRHDDV